MTNPADSSGPIGVVGAGSWGTALAVSLALAGREVVLWARRRELVESLARGEANPYLPEIQIPRSVRFTSRLSDLAGCEPLVIVVASHGVRDTVAELLREVPGELTLVSASKGVETETLERMTQVFAEEAARCGRSVHAAVLSGPTFAEEVAQRVPSAAVVAADDSALARRLQGRLAAPWLRLYSTQDVVGVELAGTAKNVIAIAAGVRHRPRPRPQHARGADHPRPARDHPPGRRLRRRSAHLRRPRRPGRPGADLHRRPVAQPPRSASRSAAGKTLAEALAETIQVAEGVRNSLAISRAGANPRRRDADHRADGRGAVTRTSRPRRGARGADEARAEEPRAGTVDLRAWPPDRPDPRLRQPVHPADRAPGAREPGLLRGPPVRPADRERSARRAPIGLILSGGPQSVYEPGAPQAAPRALRARRSRCSASATACRRMAHPLGGAVEAGSSRREYGRAEIEVRPKPGDACSTAWRDARRCG